MPQEQRGRGQQNNHWLPAAFLARFSARQSGPTRERPLYTLARGQRKPEPKTAKTVASEADRYFLTLASNAKAVDEIWSYYENRLSSALNRLITPPLSRSTTYVPTLEWLTVLVPFVAAAMVRAPDFDRRYAARLGAAEGVGTYNVSLYDEDLDGYFANPETFPIPLASGLSEAERPDNMNRARLIELQRLLPRVFTADWYVPHTPANESTFVLPDTGYISGGPQAVIPDCMLTLPVGPHHVIALGHKWWNTVAKAGKQGWVTPVSHIEVPGELAIRSNHAAARECEQFVVGGGESELSALVKTLAEDLLPVEDSAWLLATPRNVLQLTEAEWYKLVSAVVKYRPGDRRVADFEKDWRVLRRYVKTVMLTVDRPYLDHIALCTNEDYSSIFSCLPLEVNEIGGDVTEIKYYEGSPGERIVGTAATPDDARQVATVDGAQPQS